MLKRRFFIASIIAFLSVTMLIQGCKKSQNEEKMPEKETEESAVGIGEY